MKLQIQDRNVHSCILCFTVLIKKNKNSNDITECCIMGYKYSIMGTISNYSNKGFSYVKNVLFDSTALTSQWAGIFLCNLRQNYSH